MKVFITKHKNPEESHKEIRVIADSWIDAEIALIEVGEHDLSIEGELIGEIPFNYDIDRVIGLN